jgi:hypothetical protein
VRGVVPKQMVGPAARLAQRIHVGAAEEIGLRPSAGYGTRPPGSACARTGGSN